MTQEFVQCKKWNAGKAPQDHNTLKLDVTSPNTDDMSYYRATQSFRMELALNIRRNMAPRKRLRGLNGRFVKVDGRSSS